MIRLTRRDRKLRAAFKRSISFYSPEPVNMSTDWDGECELVFDAEDEGVFDRAAAALIKSAPGRLVEHD